MYKFFIFFVVCLLFALTVKSQDIIVTNLNDTLFCKIKKIEEDSSIYYKCRQRNDPYHGYLKKEYWEYCEFNKNIGVKNSDKYFAFSVLYGNFPMSEGMSRMFSRNKNLVSALTTGVLPSVQYSNFIYFKDFKKRSKMSRINFSLGLKYGLFIKSTIEKDASVSTISFDVPFFEVNNANSGYADVSLNRNSHYADLVFSISSNKKLMTVVTQSCGIRMDFYEGKINNNDFGLRARFFHTSTMLEQELFRYKRSSLFITACVRLNIEKSSKLKYLMYKDYSKLSYRRTVLNSGYCFGLSYKYFFK